MDEHEKVLVAQIGRNVKRLMDVRGMSKDDLAAASAVDRGRLDELLSGEGSVLVDVLFLLAGGLKVTPAELLDGITWVPTETSPGGEYVIDEDEGS